MFEPYPKSKHPFILDGECVHNKKDKPDGLVLCLIGGKFLKWDREALPKGDTGVKRSLSQTVFHPESWVRESGPDSLGFAVSVSQLFRARLAVYAASAC